MKKQIHRPGRAGQSGFSLIELIIVLTVIAILGAVVVPTLQTYREKALIASAEEAGRQILNAFTAHAATSDGNCYPGQVASFDDVVRIAGLNGVRLTAKQQALFQGPGALSFPVDYICLKCLPDMSRCWRIPCPPADPIPVANGASNFSLSIPIHGIERPAGSELFLHIHSVEGVSVQTGPVIIPSGP